MRAMPVLAAVAALLLLGACSRELREEAEGAKPAQTGLGRRDCELGGLVTRSARSASERLFAVPSPGGELVELDPRTLRPLAGRRVGLEGHVGFAELSPSGRLLALGSGDSTEIHLVDVERMRLRSHFDLAAGALDALAWVGEERLLALAPPALEGESSRILVVDTARARVIRTEPLKGQIQHAEATGGGLVVLLAPPERIGPATLALIDREGRVCSVSLPEILAGMEGGPSEPHGAEVPLRQRSPGLALDRLGPRALVVDAGLRVAAVDLAELSVNYHQPTERVSLWRRFRDWFEPRAAAKFLEGPQRQAVSLGNGLVAVSGVDYRTEGEEVRVDPAGLRLIDTRTWTVETIDTEPSFLYRAGNTLFATVDATESSGARVRAYDAKGDLRLELAAGASLWVAESAAGYVYVGEDEARRYRRIAVASGAVRRLETETELWLIGETALGS